MSAAQALEREQNLEVNEENREKKAGNVALLRSFIVRWRVAGWGCVHARASNGQPPRPGYKLQEKLVASSKLCRGGAPAGWWLSVVGQVIALREATSFPGRLGRTLSKIAAARTGRKLLILPLRQVARAPRRPPSAAHFALLEVLQKGAQSKSKIKYRLPRRRRALGDNAYGRLERREVGAHHGARR